MSRNCVKSVHGGVIGMRLAVCAPCLLLILAALHAQTYAKARSYMTEGKIDESPASTRVIADGHRPLFQVIGAFEKDYGWMGLLIDYEDPLYESKYDLVDDTAPQWRATHPNLKGAA